MILIPVEPSKVTTPAIPVRQAPGLLQTFLYLPFPAIESGVDQSVTAKFPGSEVKVGSAASGAGDNREIPVDEGGDLVSKPGEKGGSGQ